MSTEPKPLFRPEVLGPRLASFRPPQSALAARPKLAHWARLLGTPQAAKLKETELRDEFLYDVFRDLLGYVSAVEAPAGYTLRKEAFVQVDGTYADAGFGQFTPADSRFVTVLEGKGPNDPLDKPYKSRKRSAVEQAVLYALQLRIDWYLVTNLRETRLYCKRDDIAHFERFDTARAAGDDAEFARLVFLLGAERVVGTPGHNHLDELLGESKKVGRELTADFYREYRDLRARTFEALRAHNPRHAPRDLLAAAQKVLDRVLFIAFCEDRDLLPAESVAKAYRHADPYNPRPVWENFKGLFNAVNAGSDSLGVFAYNGGLFAPDPFVDALVVPNEVCEGFKKLADYEYGTRYAPGRKLIDVEILGHIFEQSISDLEELHQQIAVDPSPNPLPHGERGPTDPPSLGGKGAGGLGSSRAGPSKRKREGAFYTPEFITRYIVAETLGPALRERFEALRQKERERAGDKVKKLLNDPRATPERKLKPSERTVLVRFWREWIADLERVKIVDPACGSGAFLIEAFDQMFAEYEKAQGYLTELEQAGLFDISATNRTILTSNLFGIDLNAEAVEIARLSCWIKTAAKGSRLTALDDNIKQGNSVVGRAEALSLPPPPHPAPPQAGPTSPPRRGEVKGEDTLTRSGGAAPASPRRGEAKAPPSEALPAGSEAEPPPSDSLPLPPVPSTSPPHGGGEVAERSEAGEGALALHPLTRSGSAAPASPPHGGGEAKTEAPPHPPLRGDLSPRYGGEVETPALGGVARTSPRPGSRLSPIPGGEAGSAQPSRVRGSDSSTSPPSPLEFWRAQFPDAFRAGGFDVVIANPPYVRQEWISADKPYLEKHYRAYDGVADLYVYFYELALTLLKPGGRLGFIVTNKWMKAGYGEPLRKLYAEEAWVETVVDLGHNKQIFPDADVFPCILTARKPSDALTPPTVRACCIPREQFRVDDLSRQIREEGVEVPRSRFGAEPWNLEPPGVAKLMEKLRTVGVPLKEFAEVGPLRGVVTGCNEAFIVDTPTRDKLIAEHPSSEAVVKKYLRGQDVDRWRSVWSGEWMIFARRGIDIDQFPAIKRHLEQFRTQLEPKPKDWTGKDWPGRKPGTYKWYELQDPVDYWREFEKPKVVFQDIAWNPRFSLDTSSMYGNNTVYLLPSPDLWTLAALNAPVSWWFAWRGAQHGKDEALRLFAAFMEGFPIPKPTDAQRAEAEAAVRRLIDLTRQQQEGRAAVLDWLRVEFAVAKPSQKLQAVAGLDADAMVAEVRKARGKPKPLSVAEVKRLKDEHAASVAPLAALAREAEALERRVSEVVNAAYGLTPDEVRLMWETAPPRMPITT